MVGVLVAQSGGGVCGVLGVLVYLALIVFVVAGFWKTFAKAGQPGWAALIPFYNAYVLCRIAGRPGWWVILMLVPLVNIVIVGLVSVEVARAFGKSSGFAVGLMLLGFIFYPILGFGAAQYQGPSH